jgi:two-component system OmpR family response regulator
MRILLVEDDRKIASFILKGLTEHGYAVRHSGDGQEALNIACGESFDMMIVDIMLPSLDGLALIEKVRAKQISIPVIILSAKRSVDDRIRGLTTGGDDYITKPFAFSELLARIQTLMRRVRGVVEVTKLSVSDLHLDLMSRHVVRGGKDIDLQPREFALLAYLMRNSGKVISKAMIMEHVWDYCFDPQTNVVEARVCRLREKIDNGFEEKLIHTVRGVGYVLRQ